MMRFSDLHSRDRTVLDVGCGNGIFTRKIAAEFHSVTSIDISARRLAFLGEACAREGIGNVHIHRMDARKLHFPDSSFDVAVLYRSLDHMADRHRVVEEIFRTLKPDGILYIENTDSSFDSPGARNLDALRDLEDEILSMAGMAEGECEIAALCRDEIAGMLKDAGFGILHAATVEREESAVDTYVGSVRAAIKSALEAFKDRNAALIEGFMERYGELSRSIDREGVVARPGFELFAAKAKG